VILKLQRLGWLERIGSGWGRKKIKSGSVSLNEPQKVEKVNINKILKVRKTR
jgi:hypothetical protein